MPSAPQNTQKPRKSRFGGLVLGTPSRWAASGHPTAFDGAWGGPVPEGGRVAPVRGEGKFEGEGGFSAPPSPSRQLQRGLPGSLEGAAQGSLAPRRKAVWGPGKGQKGAVNRLRSPKRHPCEGGGAV